MLHSVQVENLSKCYRLGLLHARSLRDLLDAGVRHLFGKPSAPPSPPPKQPADRDFWALRDVSFELSPGDVLGIIGRNGAGKSTLLKVLARITSPTAGRARLTGRVASLLEVGTGFHPELTGRENIFLNGTVLGMSRAEVQRQFDAIVDFSGVEAFLETPVKRYSSGMYTRLAFAVAAHLEPEILIVDEVLAVGDAEFQRKCLARMGQVARGGRTVLFVSHNMMAVEELCQKAMLLVEGRVKRFGGDVRSVVQEYLTGSGHSGRSEWRDTNGQFANPYFTPRRFWLADEHERPLAMPAHNDRPIRVIVEGEVARLDGELTVGYAALDEHGRTIFWSCMTDTAPDSWPALRVGHCTLTSEIPSRLLNEGDYRLHLCVKLPGREWCCQPSANAPVVELCIRGGLSDSPRWMSRRPGFVAPVLPWRQIC